MTAIAFVDANVLVYARQANEPLKQPIAAQWIERLWADQLGRTSIQALNEAYVTLTRKIRPVFSESDAWEYVRAFLAWDAQPVDADLVRRAREIQQHHRLSWWDSLIVGAAQMQNCSLLLTEDLQDRSVYGSLTVRNPFTLSVSESSPQYGATPPVVGRHRPRGRPRKTTK